MRHFPTPFALRAVLALLLFVPLLSSCSGCNDEAVGSADVTIIGVDPEAGYQGVEIAISFAIEPGADTDADGMVWRVDFGDGTQTSGDGIEDTARHIYDLAGEYEIAVRAVFNGEEVGRATTPYRVFAPIDLTASNLRGAPANLRTGDDITVSLDIENAQASDVQTPFDVRFYFSASAQVTDADVENLTQLGTLSARSDQEETPVIATGESRNLGLTAPVPAAVESGDYFIVAVIDPDVKVGDTDRTNNLLISDNIVRVENVSETTSDLVVESVLAIPDRAFPTLNTVTRAFTLTNRGTVDAFDVVHKTYLSIGDATLDAQDTLIDTSDPIEVFGGERLDIGPAPIVLDNEIIPPAGDPIQVWVIVTASADDPAYVEGNESDNSAFSENPITVSDEPVDGPDVVVRSFNVTPTSTFLNGTLEIETTIANEGTQDVGSFFCAIYLGAQPRIDTQTDPRLDNINLPTLASTEVLDITRTITVPGLFDPGTYYLYIVCDPTNALGEPFRSNNSVIFPDPVTITDEADVDISVGSVAVPAAVNEGDDYDVIVSVCAGGTNPTGLTSAALYRGVGNPDYDGEPLVIFDVPNVNPGECEDVTVTLEASCDDFVDTYSFGAEADYDDILPETDETNNRRSGSNVQVVSGTFCACNEDAFEPNNQTIDAEPVTPGTFDAALCDPGTCDFFAVALNQNDSLVVTNTFQSDKGDLNTAIFDTTGTQQLDLSNDVDLQEVAAFLVPQTGDYFIRVCGVGGADKNLYSLDVQVFPQSPTVDVVARDVTIPTRTLFSVGAQMDVSFRAYNIGQLDASGFDAQLVVSPNKTLGDGDDVVLTNASAGTIPAGSFRDLQLTGTLPTSLVDGDYYMAVVLDPLGQLTESDTSNNVAFSTVFSVGRECFDPLEPNDDFAEARLVTDGTYSNLVACTAAADYYRICPNDAQELTATVTFDQNLGDIDLFLYDEQTTQIDSSAGVGGIEQVGIDYVNGNQCYFVQVRIQALPGQDIEMTYELDIDVQDVDPSLRCTGVFESNDAFATASSLVAATTGMLTLDRCPQVDTDFYYVDLQAGQQVGFTGTLTPAMQQGTLRLQVYLPTQIPGPNIETAPGVPVAQLAYVAPTSGRYYLQVTISGSQRNVTYTLDTTGLGGIDLKPENLVIGPGSYRANDEIRYEFDLRNLGSDNAIMPPYELFFGLQTTPDIADTSLKVSTSADVAGNTSVLVSDRANVPAGAAAGTAYLHIVVDEAGILGDVNPANNVITIPITIIP